jgi:hypothetical protein
MNITAIRKEVAAVCDRRIARLDRVYQSPAESKVKREISYLQDLKFRWIESSALELRAQHIARQMAEAGN